jgi:transcriptional regulator with GAF, ATPase, and Fis domain
VTNPSPSETPGPLTSDDFETLLEASRALASTLELPALLKKVMELAARVVRAESASLLLKDEKTDELYFDVALGAAGDKVKTVRLKSGEGVAGWVATNGIPLIVNDVENDPRWTHRVDNQSDFVTRQVVAVPLHHQGACWASWRGLTKRAGGRSRLWTDVRLKSLRPRPRWPSKTLAFSREFWRKKKPWPPW